MEISKTLWIILAVSIFVAIVIMISSFVIMKSKINKIKEKNMKNIVTQENKVFERKDHGELLWDLKNKSKKPLGDFEMEFFINTAIRNKYKTFNIINSYSDYEKKTLEKIPKLKHSEKFPDITIIFNSEKFNDFFDKSYKILKEKQMIGIVNAPIKNKEIKKFCSYLKLINAKYDKVDIGKGIILIVK